ncbi:MAG: YciI family protein [Caulobacterales bacterium]
MLFVILASDRPGALELRLATRPKHIDYWNATGAVKIAGAMLENYNADGNPKGSIVIVDAPDLATVNKMLADDPYTLAGVFGDDVRIELLRPGIGEWKPA